MFIVTPQSPWRVSSGGIVPLVRRLDCDGWPTPSRPAVASFLDQVGTDPFADEAGSWGDTSAGTGTKSHVVGPNLLPAGCARNNRGASMPSMAKADRRAVVRCLPLVAPRRQCHEDRCYFASGIGEDIFDAPGVVRIRTGLHNVMCDEVCQPIGEQVPADTKVGNQLVESTDPDKQIPQDER
jgi:hypothetical protein